MKPSLQHDTVERFDIKQLSFGRDPPQLELPFPSHSHWIQFHEEQGKGFHLPIMSHSSKTHVPHNRNSRKYTWVATETSFVQVLPNKIGKAS
jgi:hypothetical protein